MTEGEINDYFGDIDLFLLDQVLKGSLGPPGNLLDVGFGSGRNMVYFLNAGWHIWGIDTDQSQVQLLRYLFQQYPDQDPTRLTTGSVQSIPLTPASVDLVICSRVLHHLPSPDAVKSSCEEMHRVLKPDGVLYLSMNSTINFESHLLNKEGGRVFRNGTRGVFLTDLLLDQIVELGFSKIMPHRTVHFEDQHAETTLILKKI